MAVNVIKCSEESAYGESLASAATALRNGGLVIFPTETVYGLAARMAPEPLAALRDAKGNRGEAPFTIHLASPRDAARYAPDAPTLAKRLARKLWPGPLTLVVPAGASQEWTGVEDHVLSMDQHGGRWVGLRCPDHIIARELARQAESTIVASSANRSGEPPPHDAVDAVRSVGQFADIALDSGPTTLHAASTVVEVRPYGWRVMRAGALAERTIQRAAVTRIVFLCTGNTCRSPMAEYLFRRELARRLDVPEEALPARGYEVASAGMAAALHGPISSGSQGELSRRGIDASRHRSQPATSDLLQAAERIYAMTQDHQRALRAAEPGLSARVTLLDAEGAVADPIGGGPDDYRRCADQIERAVIRRVEELLDEDRDWQ